MELNQALLEVARSQIGVFEWKEGSNPAVLEYFEASGHGNVTDDDVPWCAAFLGYCCAAVMIPHTGSLRAKSYLNWGDRVRDVRHAEAGDVFVFDRGAVGSPAGHVGIFTGEVRNSPNGVSHVEIIGGNQGDRVSARWMSVERLEGIRRARVPRTGSPLQSNSVSAGIGALGGGLAAATTTAVELGPLIVEKLDALSLTILILGAMFTLFGVAFMLRDRVQKWRAGVR